MSHTYKDFKEIEIILAKGYVEMSEINLEEAEYAVRTDAEALRVCEEKLTECE